jgi:hypothetical protein
MIDKESEVYIKHLYDSVKNVWFKKAGFFHRIQSWKTATKNKK